MWTNIGARLMIDRELAAHIVLELQGIGWLNPAGMPTASGRRALDEDEAESVDEQTVGWVFTDPFTGNLWPRFHAGELPYAVTQPSARGFPELISGTPGHPHRDSAFCVLPRPREVIQRTQPKADAIVRAVRSHRRHHAWNDDVEAADAPLVRRVSFVGEEPSAYLLAARAWQDPMGAFCVDDPFGIGDSPRFRGWIEARFATHPGLREWLAEVAGGDAEATDLKSLIERAAWDVETKLSVAVRSRTALYDRLVATQRALLETELPECPEDKWDDVALKAQRAAERLLIELRELHPPRVRLSEDVTFNEALLDDLAGAPGSRCPCPGRCRGVRRGKVAARGRTGDRQPAPAPHRGVARHRRRRNAPARARRARSSGFAPPPRRPGVHPRRGRPREPAPRYRAPRAPPPAGPRGGRDDVCSREAAVTDLTTEIQWQRTKPHRSPQRLPSITTSSPTAGNPAPPAPALTREQAQEVEQIAAQA